MKNLLIHAPEMEIITAEGTDRLYEELDIYLEQKKEYLPTVFDVLNCEHGCNSGPAMGMNYQRFAMNDIMHAVERHARKLRKQNTTKKGVDKQFVEFDALRRQGQERQAKALQWWRPISGNCLRVPNLPLEAPKRMTKESTGQLTISMWW